MQDRDILLTIAEVAVTFAGFASLVTLFGVRASRDGSRIDTNRLRTMLLGSLLVAFLCFVPFVPLRFGFSEPAVWRIASGVLMLALLALSLRILRDYRDVRAAEIRLGRVIRVVIGVLVLGPMLLAARNTFGSYADSEAHYLVCLLSLLALAGIQFARLIDSMLLVPAPDATAEDE